MFIVKGHTAHVNILLRYVSFKVRLVAALWMRMAEDVDDGTYE